MMALALAMCMAMGMNTVAFAAGHDPATGPHGDSTTGAVVGGESKTDMNSDPKNYDINTQFYVNVDQDATSGEVIIPDEEIVPGDGITCHYELGYEIKRASNVSVTVPLYVCMYGYGGDGKIVTPADDAYQMKNSSTYTEAKKLVSITPCYKIEVITTTNFATLPGEVVTAYNAAHANTSGQWGWYREGASGAYEVVSLSDCDKHVDGNYTSACAGVDTYFYRGVKDTANGSQITASGSAGPVYTIGETVTGTDTKKGLKVNVPTIKAENQTWKLMEMKNNDATTLKAGELCMSINGLDLSKAAENLDIKDLDWEIDEPTVDGDNVTATALDLPVKAVMAGGSVNEDGCVPVVRVTYTIAPQY